MSVEEWRPIAGYEELYEVSSWGRVKSLARTILRRNAFGGVSRHPRPERILKPSLVSTGYHHVTLYRDGNGWACSVHHLVCTAFQGPRPPKCEVAHHDGDRGNDHADNLRWATRVENHADQYRHGTKRLGEASTNAKLRSSEVRAIRNAEPGSDGRLGKEMGVSRSTVRSARLRRSWRHLD